MKNKLDDAELFKDKEFQRAFLELDGYSVPYYPSVIGGYEFSSASIPQPNNAIASMPVTQVGSFPYHNPTAYDNNLAHALSSYSPFYAAYDQDQAFPGFTQNGEVGYLEQREEFPKLSSEPDPWEMFPDAQDGAPSVLSDRWLQPTLIHNPTNIPSSPYFFGTGTRVVRAVYRPPELPNGVVRSAQARHASDKSRQTVTPSPHPLATPKKETVEKTRLKFEALIDEAKSIKRQSQFQTLFSDTLGKAISLYDRALYDEERFPQFVDYFCTKIFPMHHPITDHIITKDTRILEYLSSSKITEAARYAFFLKSLADNHRQDSFIDYYHKILPLITEHIKSSSVLIKYKGIKALLAHFAKHDGTLKNGHPGCKQVKSVCFYPIMAGIFDAIDDVGIFSAVLKFEFKLKNVSEVSFYIKTQLAMLILVIDLKINMRLIPTILPDLSTVDISEENIQSHRVYAQEMVPSIYPNHVRSTIFNEKKRLLSEMLERSVKARTDEPADEGVAYQYEG